MKTIKQYVSQLGRGRDNHCTSQGTGTPCTNAEVVLVVVAVAVLVLALVVVVQKASSC